MATAKTTTDHAEIKKWVEARGGCPAHVKSTGRRGDPGILRIDYTGFSGEDTLEAMEWDDWFEAFDAAKLAFVYDPAKKSRFSKLVARTTAKRAAPKRTTKKTAAKRTATKRGTTTAKRTTKRASAPKKRATTAKRRTAKRTSTRASAA